MQFLDWFVKEQAKKKNIEDLVKYDLFGNDERGLFLLNNEASGATHSWRHRWHFEQAELLIRLSIISGRTKLIINGPFWLKKNKSVLSFSLQD